MDADAIKKSQDETKAGLHALEQGRKDVAGIHFMNALNHLDEVQDDKQRCSKLGNISVLLDRVGFTDLALMAAQDAIELDEKLEDYRHLPQDILAYGNAHLHLGNTRVAEDSYRRALKICLEHGDFANAASASTNLAIIIGKEDRMDEAIQMLKDSLGYLKQQQHPDTEITTCIALIQALEVQEREPELSFDTAKKLFKWYADRLRPDQLKNTVGPLKDTIERYLQSHPEIDGEKWKAQNFPRLYS